MKQLTFLFTFFLFLSLNSGFSDEIQNYLPQNEMMIYSPSLESVISTAKSLLKRFYGKNYVQMAQQISTDSKSIYGLDIFDLQSIETAGINIKKPIAYVHISNEAGFLLVPVASKKTLESFIRKNIGETMNYKFYGDFIALSENKELIANITNTNRISQNEGFSLCAQKLNFKWDQVFVWIESKYLSSVSESIGVSSNIKLPYGFTALLFQFLEGKITIKNYSGILSPSQTQFMRNMRSVSAVEKYNILDYIWGNPAAVGHCYLNMPMLYKYYTYIDTINILGIKGFINELWQKYKINVERDLINNSDGRLNIVVDELDTVSKKYRIYGSLGVKSPEIAKAFMDSMQAAIIQNNEKLYSFEMFTKPFYHYESTNYSLYYGVIDNEFVYSTDKEILVQLVKNIFGNNNGYLLKMPAFFQNAVAQKSAGYYITVDVQSLFSSIKTGVEISKDLLIGVKDINIYGNPDNGDNPYGWNTTIDINFYK